MPKSENESDTTPEDEAERFQTASEFARFLNVSDRHVRREIAKGEIVVHRFGGAVRIGPADREDYIKRRRAAKQ